MEFTYTELAHASEEERTRLLNALAAELTYRLRGAADFESEVRVVVDELRSQGHDLWNFDSDDDFQIWCASWAGESSRPGIVLDFRRDGEVTVDWPDA